MTIDLSALSQIDAPRCVDWTSKKQMGDQKLMKRERLNVNKTKQRDRADTVDIITMDHIDAMFDEAAGYA